MHHTLTNKVLAYFNNSLLIENIPGLPTTSSKKCKKRVSHKAVRPTLRARNACDTLHKPWILSDIMQRSWSMGGLKIHCKSSSANLCRDSRLCREIHPHWRNNRCVGSSLKSRSSGRGWDSNSSRSPRPNNLWGSYFGMDRSLCGRISRVYRSA